MGRIFEKKNLIKLITYITMIIILIPILIIALYNHPSADDYGYSDTVYKTIQVGGNCFDIIKEAIKSTIEGMQVWQGLYSSGFLLALQPAVFGEQFYGLVTYIMILTIILGIGFLIKRVNKYIFKSNSKDWIILTFLISFFIIQTIPSPLEGLFWFNGAMNYTFFMMLLLYEISLLIKYYNINKISNKIFILVWTSIVSFIMSGGNHVTAFLSMLVIICFITYSIIKKQYKTSLAYVVILIFGIIGFYINMTSEGTAIRSNAIDCNSGIIETMIKSAYQAIIYINEWTSISLILMLIAATPFIYTMLTKNNFYQKIKWKWIFISIILSYGAICAMLCVPYYAMGWFGAGRLTDIVYITFVVLTVLNYTYAMGIILKYIDITNVVNYIANIKTYILCFAYILVLIIIAIAGNENTYTTSHEALVELISGEAKEYDEEMDSRIKYYSDESLVDVELESLTVYPKLLYFQDLSTDSKDWKNIDAAIYYDKNTIKIKTQSNN